MAPSPQMRSTQSDPDMLPHQIYLNLQKILRSLNIGRTFQGKRLPITIMQMRALSLFNEQESVTITDISKSLGMSLQSATNLIFRLEQLGYLERSKNEKDKRVSDVRLTAKGKKRLNAFRSNEVENVKLLLDRLNPVEIKVLNETLNGVALLFEKATITSSR
jgi:MarR family transcriptional regulator, organic hydroperoxide resistance regulator